MNPKNVLITRLTIRFQLLLILIPIWAFKFLPCQAIQNAAHPSLLLKSKTTRRNAHHHIKSQQISQSLDNSLIQEPICMRMARGGASYGGSDEADTHDTNQTNHNIVNDVASNDTPLSPKNDETDGDINSSDASSSTTLWGSITSAFQMNIDAKEELIHDKQLYAGNVEESKIHARTRTVDDAETQIVSEILEQHSHEEYDDDQEEYDEETAQNEESSTATASSRILLNGEESDDDYDDYIETADRGAESSEEVSESYDDKEETESQSESKIIAHSQDSESTRKLPESDQQSQIVQIEQFDSLNRKETRTVENVSIYTQIDESSSDSEIDIITTPTNNGKDSLEDEPEHESENSSTMEEDDDSEDLDYHSPPTLEEIVREEWSMIPETEVEDEGEENELREEIHGRNDHNNKNRKKDNKDKKRNNNKDRVDQIQQDAETKKKNKDKKKKKNKDKENKKNQEKDGYRQKQGPIDGSMVVEPTHERRLQKAADSEKNEQVSATPISPYISSGFVSFFIKNNSRFVTFIPQFLIVM